MDEDINKRGGRDEHKQSAVRKGGTEERVYLSIVLLTPDDIASCVCVSSSQKCDSQ